MKKYYQAPLFDIESLTAADVMAASDEVTSSNTSSAQTENRYAIIGDMMTGSNTSSN